MQFTRNSVGFDQTIMSARQDRLYEVGFDPPDAAVLGDMTPGAVAQTHVRQMIDLMITTSPDSVYIKDRQGRFVFANASTARQHGFEQADALIGKSDFDLHPVEIAQAFFAQEQEIMRTGVPIVERCERNGGQRWFSSTKVPIREQDGRGCIVGLIGVARNITDQRGAETLLIEQTEVIEMIALNAPIGRILDKLITLAESRLPGVSGTIQALASAEPSGLEPSPAERGDYAEIHPGHAPHRGWSARISSDDQDLLGTLTFTSPDARVPTRHERDIVELSGRTARIALERERASSRIHDLAYRDPLTGLLNRVSLNEMLPEVIGSARAASDGLHLAVIDLDEFRLLNDTLGHAAGDTILKAIAGRMLALADPSASIFRIGGDEFVIVQRGGRTKRNAVASLKRICSAIAKPIDIAGHPVCVTGSVGLATFARDGATAAALMMNADAAMHRAKALGRNRIQLYRSEMRIAAEERLTLNRDLQRALALGEFELHYQPQVDLRTGAIFAVEALLRWRHPTLGYIAPDKFIPLAEETGAIVPIGAWVLREACAQCRTWQDQGLPPIVVCVNVSPRQFRERNWTGSVLKTLEQTGIESRFLEIEITESCLMVDVDQAIASMTLLRRNGISIAIDDFGTGYSNLGALKRFPLSRLKIDRSFVADMLGRDSDRAIACAFISLGQTLGLRVIAEGVETSEQFDFLCRNNCDEMQGYWFSRPLTAAALAERLGRPDAGVPDAARSAA